MTHSTEPRNFDIECAVVLINITNVIVSSIRTMSSSHCGLQLVVRWSPFQSIDMVALFMKASSVLGHSLAIFMAENKCFTLHWSSFNGAGLDDNSNKRNDEYESLSRIILILQVNGVIVFAKFKYIYSLTLPRRQSMLFITCRITARTSIESRSRNYISLCTFIADIQRSLNDV